MTSAALLALAIVNAGPVVRAEQNLARLGSPRYAAREKAGWELVKLGRHALPALRRGEGHPDPEVAERCKRLIPFAEAEAIRQRVAVLLQTPQRPVPADIPLARQFLTVTGDTREARQLYADVYVTHARLLERIHLARAVADALFGWPGGKSNLPEGQFFSALSPGRPPAPHAVAPRADLALFFFLSAEPGVHLGGNRVGVGMIHTQFFDGPTMRDAAAEIKASPALQKLFLVWLAGPRSFEDPFAEVASVRAGFRLAADLALPQARDVALRVALDREQWICGRAAALLALERVGRVEDASRVAPLIRDDTLAAAGAVPGTPGVTVLIGDIALGVCVTLAGTRPADFGFPNAGAAPEQPADLFHFGFPSDGKDRAAARKKWAALHPGRTTPAGGKP